ncbi:hypothetical protein FP435_00900 [Lactobacillus sp. PV037]|uniref:hypothetical protein n=1 Tax=Lactobacillus sp. PV037 TaxID=2594496 RepID=UPI0022407BA0|nr:hypothetical protein [Lactobacillus sp. PV037]QNQ83098.1 hypothetical protein FP435_00900 [Lactobacillus sp. PV037]
MKKKTISRILIILLAAILPLCIFSNSASAATSNLKLYKSKKAITVYAGQTVKAYRSKHKTFSDLYLNEGKIGSTTTVDFYYQTKKGKVNFYRGFGAYVEFVKGMKLKAVISTDVEQLTPHAEYKFRTEGMNMGYNSSKANKSGVLSGWMMRPGVVVSVKVKNKPHKKHHAKKTKKNKQHTKKVRK